MSGRPGRGAARGWLGLGVLLVVALPVARVAWSSREELRLGDERAAAGDAEGAVERFGYAARLYLPGSPWSRRALDRLEGIARAAEAAGDLRGALVAWREVRSAVLATRAIYAPNAARRQAADQRIAALSAALESPSVDPGADPPARQRWHEARLARTEEPSPLWSLAALAGLAGFLAAAVGFLLRALDERDRIRPGSALRWAIGMGLGFALFVVALAKA